MSEYQCYEFVALERPLTAKQMAELRGISTRAQISTTRFWNAYDWGDLKADPARLLARYFDVHLYSASWGTRRLMLRVPRARVDVKVLKSYFGAKHVAALRCVGEYVVLDLCSETEEPEYDDREGGSVAALSPLREELMRGDLRCAYLAWLLSVQAGDLDERAKEPPVPARLATASAAQEAMIELLRVEKDLLAVAARGVAGKRRTVGVLRALAETERAAREGVEAARAKKAHAAAETSRQRRLDTLGRSVGAAWVKLEKLVAESQYNQAVKLAVDLRDLSVREGRPAGFAKRFEAMRKRQLRRRGFFDRWKRREDDATPA